MPKKNTAFIFDLPLVNASARPSFKVNPAIAAGDFKISIDEGAFVNLATLPTVAPAGGTNLKISLSASEMNGDRIVVQCIDQTAQKEWDDVVITIETSVSSIDDIQTDIDTGLGLLANIAAVGGAVNMVAESYVLTTGTQTSGTYASTALLDAIPHTHTDTAGTLDLYYQFDVGVQGLPSAVGVTAYANGASDDIAIQAYNWGSATFETVGTIIGKSGATYDTGTYTLLTRHAGVGANIGKVRIRFYSAALTSATLRVDQIFVSYAVGQAYQYTAGTVVDAAATTASFKTSLTQVDNFWNDTLLVFTSGALAGQAKPIQDFANANGTITLDELLTSAPANGDAFVIKADHIHPVSQIRDGLPTAVAVASVQAVVDAINAIVASTGVVLTAAERIAVADVWLDRDMSIGADNGSSVVRTPRQALRSNRNKVSILGGMLTVTKEDDTTASWTAAVTTSPGDPISGVDPA